MDSNCTFEDITNKLNEDMLYGGKIQVFLFLVSLAMVFYFPLDYIHLGL